MGAHVAEQLLNRMRSNPAIPGNNRRRCGCSRARVREQPPKVRLFPFFARYSLACIYNADFGREESQGKEKRKGTSENLARATL